MRLQIGSLLFVTLMMGVLLVSSPVFAETVNISTAETSMRDLEALSGGALPKTALVTPTGSVAVSTGTDSAIWAKTNGWSVTVSSGRTVQSGKGGVNFNTVKDASGNDLTGTLVNGGYISASGTTDFIFGVNAGSASSITNQSGATISGTTSANYGLGIFVGDNSSITNNSGGSISGTATGAYGLGIYGGKNTTVDNSGTISGASATNANGVYSGTGSTVTNRNGGVISAIGAGNTASTYGIYISGAGTVTNENGGTISVTGPSATYGTTYGIRTIGAGAITNAGTITVNGTGTSGGIRTGNNSTVTNAATGIINVSGSGMVEGISMGSGAKVTNNGAINVTGTTGIAVTRGDVTNNGAITVNGGNGSMGLNLISASTALNNGTITVTGSPGAIGAYIDGSGTLTNSGAGNITSSGAGVVFRSVASGTGTVTNYGAITGVTGVKDKTDVTGGNLTIDNYGSITGTGGTAISLAGDNNTVIIHEGSTITGALAADGSGNTLELAGAGSYASDITGAWALTKSGIGTVVVSGTNTYTGGTTVSAGNLQGNTNSLQGNILNNSQVTFNQGTTGTYGGIMSGAGSLLKEGTGTLTLSNDNTYTGPTTINAGMLTINGGITSDVSIDTAGTLSGGGTVAGNVVNNGNVTGFGATGGMTIQGDLTNNAGGTVRVVEDAKTLTVTGAFTNNGTAEFTQNGSNTNTYSGNIGGLGAGGSLLKTGTGTQIFSADQSYSGTTSVTAGTLVLQGSTQSSAINIAAQGTLRLDRAVGAATHSGTISGAGNIRKTGAGEVSIRDTTTGSLSVQAGKLTVANSFAAASTAVSGGANLSVVNAITSSGSFLVDGAMTVPTLNLGAAGTLSGNGTVTGNVVNNGSVTGFGATGGMTIQGDLTNNAGGTVRVAEDDKMLTVTGAFTNNGAAEFTQNGSNSNTYSGNIGGLGAGGFLLKTGAGTQILAADQSYTGVTKINGGTLVLQGTTLSPAMDISTGALLALDTTAGNREFNAILTGSGAVEKRGDNTLTYTGTSENFTGAADVTRGALFIQGTLAASTITVRSGATLGGSGAIRGTIINAGGTVSPGSSPGTLTVTGNFTQQTDGALAMEVTPDAMDHLEVGGSAALDGALSVDITGKQTIGKYSLLHAANGVSGVFATTTIDAHDSKQKFSIIYDSNDVWLKILAGRLYAALGLSWNGVAVGQVLDGEDSNLDTPLRPVLDLLDAMEDTAVPAALRQMQPELYSGLSETGLSLQRVFFETAKNRLHAVRSGNGSPYSAQYSLYAANSGSASDAAAAEGGPAVYMIPLGFFETYKNTGDRTGFSTKAAGLAAGAGFASGHDFAVGGQLGYAHAFMDYDDPAGSSANADYLLGGVYGSLHGSAWYLDGILQTGVAWNRMNRRILFSDINASADSSFTSFLFGASLNSGYDYRVDNYTFGPVVNLDYALEDNGSAEESGAGILNLVVRGNTAQSLKTGIGFRASAGFQSGDSGEIVPEIALKWGHEFLDGSRRITAELSGAPLAPLTVRTGDPSRDSMLMTAVLSYVMKKRMRLYGCYAGELLAPDRQSHTVALGFRMEL